MEVIKGISIFLAAAYIIAFINDIFKTALAKIKKTEYKWKSSGLLQDCQSWLSVLVFGMLIFVGFYAISNEYARIKTNEITGKMTYCEECRNQVPSKYTCVLYGDEICPNCAQKQLSNYVVIEHEKMLDSVYGAGSYISDDEDYMVLEKAECNWCGNYAPADLYDQNGERICIDCITEALQDDNVARAIQNYIEYG